MSRRTITDESELDLIAGEILGGLTKKDTAHVIALRGDLGAGKTAFTKAFARKLGVEEHITSPTFVIMKSYPIPEHPFLGTLTHIDAYRIDDVDEMRVLNFKELLADPSRVLCIEWPERITSLIPESRVEVSIEIEKGGGRTITYGE